MNKRRKARVQPQRRRAAPDGVINQLEIGIRLQQAGDLSGARRIYQNVLAEHPQQPDALHLLGLVSLQNGYPGEAVELIRGAISIERRNPAFHNNLGSALRVLGELEEAEQSLRRALRLRSDYAEAWNNLGMVLHQRERYRDAIGAYNKALGVGPVSADVLNNLGIAKRAAGDIESAMDCFQQALKGDPQHAEAHANLGSAIEEQNRSMLERLNSAVHFYEEARKRLPESDVPSRSLSHLYQRMVPHWHFTMLNDEPRNSVYDAALRKLVKPDDFVLDIGSGAGLLAMMAARAGARRVVGCEMIRPIADKAVEVVARNNLSDRITIVNRRSQDMVVGRDLDEPADLLVTEIFDAGLLGEGALSTIRHARRELVRPNARIIPARARIFGVLVESEALQHTDRVDSVVDFDLSPFNDFSISPRYLSERLNLYPHERLSDSFEVLDLDFCSDAICVENRTFPVVVTRSGTCHGIAFWFRLDLCDGITFTTSPEQPDSHWRQAIQLWAAPRHLVAGQELMVAVQHGEEGIAFDVQGGPH